MNIQKLVCMGDSLTEGYEIDKTKRWSDLLSKRLGIEVVNCGISGDTTTGMLSRFYHQVIANHPSHVIILGGTNDLWLHSTPQQIIANIHAMVRQAKYNDIVPIIGIPTPVYTPEDYSVDTYFVNDFNLSEAMREFQQILKAYVKEDEKLWIDFSDGIHEGLMLDDGVHPNEAGQEVMMETVMRFFDALKSS